MFYNYFFSICHLCSTCVHTAQHVKLGVRRDQSVFTGLISVFSFHVWLCDEFYDDFYFYIFLDAFPIHIAHFAIKQ